LPYRVTLTADAADDFRRLDGSLKQPVANQLKKLATSPLLGEHLGNKAGLDLTGYYKLYVAKKSVRIVYRVIAEEVITGDEEEADADENDGLQSSIHLVVGTLFCAAPMAFSPSCAQWSSK